MSAMPPPLLRVTADNMGEHGGPEGLMFDHLSLGVRDLDRSGALYDAAVATGGTDDGPPGIRAHYDPGYYAAFVLDPDGHHLEAVVHER